MVNEIEFISTRKAADLTNTSIKRIRHLYETGKIGYKKENRNVYVNKMDVIRYIAAHEELKNDVVWDEIKKEDGECFYPLWGYDCKYMVSNKSRVVNIAQGQVLTPIVDKKSGYYKITLMKNGEAKTEYLHRLVAKTQCKNTLDKPDVHHINADIHCNKSNNLLWVSPEEHSKLHKLMKTDKEEYKKAVKKIRDNNARAYKIPHPDYESDCKFNYYMFVDKDGYNAHKNNEDIPIKSILKESAELKEKGETNAR